MISEGWRGETQVMQMDLAGFSVSAGSACSSGKVKRSRVLQAMGFSAEQAACALRVSLGPQNKQEDIERFVEVWGAHQHRLQGRRRST
jgi:cysteine desulfurase